jgi:Fe-S-cluster containining protein
MSSDLCSACGLCCDGTLYGRVVVDEAEAASLRRHHLPVVASGSDRALPLPCAAYVRQGCTIYVDRPRGCAHYECTLYRQLRTGEVGYPEAVARITETRALADELRTLLPAGDGRPLIETLAAILGDRVDDLRARRGNAQLLMAAASLAALCRRDLDPRFGRSPEDHPRRGSP